MDGERMRRRKREEGEESKVNARSAGGAASPQPPPRHDLVAPQPVVVGDEHEGALPRPRASLDVICCELCCPRHCVASHLQSVQCPAFNRCGTPSITTSTSTATTTISSSGVATITPSSP
jgi:hypothetical protein